MTFTIYHSCVARPVMRMLLEDYGDVCRQGALWTPSKFTPIDVPWVLDNGAYSEYKSDRGWDRDGWFKVLSKAKRFVNQGKVPEPEFVVVPDYVGSADISYERSEEHRRYIPDKWEAFLAVQDGMDVDEALDVADSLDCSGIFVGGSIKWKHQMMNQFIERADKCHVARPSGLNGIRMAMGMGADSVDTSTIVCNENWHYFDHLGGSSLL